MRMWRKRILSKFISTGEHQGNDEGGEANLDIDML